MGGGGAYLLHALQLRLRPDLVQSFRQRHVAIVRGRTNFSAQLYGLVLFDEDSVLNFCLLSIRIIIALLRWRILQNPNNVQDPDGQLTAFAMLYVP